MEELLKKLIGEPDPRAVEGITHANLLCEIKLLRRALALLAAAQIRQSYGGSASLDVALSSVTAYITDRTITKWWNDTSPTGDQELHGKLGDIEDSLENIRANLPG